MFSSEDLSTELNKALQSGRITIPDGHKVAFVVHSDLDGTVTGAFAYNAGKDWQIGTVVDWSHDRGVSGGLSVSWSK